MEEEGEGHGERDSRKYLYGVSMRSMIWVLCDRWGWEATPSGTWHSIAGNPQARRIQHRTSSPISPSHYRSYPPPHIYRTFPLALAGTPFCPILLWILAPGWPLAPAAALFAFSAFFLLSLAVFFSFPSLMAACRAACRASGRCERRSLMTSREAPTMPRWDFTVRRVRFLAISWGGC